MGQANLPGFGFNNLDIEPGKFFPDISDDMQKTLSHLMAYDPVNKRCHTVTVNDDGALLVTSSAPATNKPHFGNFVVPVVASKIFNENLARKQLVIMINGTLVVYMGFDATLTFVTGIPLMPGTVVTIDNYTGEVWFLSSGGPETEKYMEF